MTEERMILLEEKVQRMDRSLYHMFCGLMRLHDIFSGHVDRQEGSVTVQPEAKQ